MKKIFEELTHKWDVIDQAQVGEIVDKIKDYEFHKIVGFGAGRMGFSIQSFMMRLSHLGLNAFMIGDTSFPKIDSDTLVFVNSSSGETKSIILYVNQAKLAGAEVVLFTDNSESTIASLVDKVVDCGSVSSSQIMKTLNEQFSLLLFDYIIECYLLKFGLDRVWVSNNHSISE
jgi:6-phospho-3-hexuloisomerase